MRYSIYVVDDDDTVTYGISLSLQNDYRVTTFSNAESALEGFGIERPDLVLLDIGLPDMNGIDALKLIKKRYPDVLVMMITGYEDVSTVVTAMKLGAYDYVTKPLHMDSLKLNVQNALESLRLKKEVQLLQERYLKENSPCLIGESNAIQDVMQMVDKVAKSQDTSVLIVGETGVGKELIASSIHFRSPLFKGPFVTLNCASIPEYLIESELFGHEKGAFSGASKTGKKGLIEMAEKGTLFLDEVADLSLSAQAKLLRFMEDGTFYKVGGIQKLAVRTRVISATNRDPEQLIKENRFRKDLYYRLAAVRLEVPALNERREDIIPIARHFMLEFNRKLGKRFTRISPEAEEALKEHHWQGNVRELRNVIERGMIFGIGPEMMLEDLDIRDKDADGSSNQMKLPPLTPKGLDIASIQESVERYYVREALRLSGGNQSQAAKLLNLKGTTFHYRQKRLLNH
jgi:DNA-binding NtrC family response regulator